VKGEAGITSAEHKGGTKFYEVQWASFGNRSVLITRWGRIGTTGQFKVDRWDYSTGAEAAAQRKKEEKIGRGYVGWTNPSRSKFTHERDVENWLAGRLEAHMRGEIRLHLLDQPGLSAGTEPPTKREPVIAPKPKIDRSADPEWGSW